MLIVQERPSVTGQYRSNKIADVLRVQARDNSVLRGFDKPQHVIWCKLPLEKYYPIAFPSAGLRDMALQVIKNASSEVVILDYNTYFCPDLITDQQARQVVQQTGLTLNGHLRHCINIIGPASTFELHKLDAFRPLTYTELLSIREKAIARFEPELASVWAKTLKVPASVMNAGLSKRQFFYHLILISNEKVPAPVSSFPGI